MDYMRFCFVPAKSQSQRLPEKNTRRLDGKELLYYPIQCAIDSGLFHEGDIVVSSDSDSIRELASGFGANTTYKRPEHLARDPYGVKDVLIDYLSNHDEHSGYDHVCILLPTAPLLVPEDIKNAYRLYLSGNFGTVMSVTETDHNALRSLYLDDGQIRPVHPECLDKKSQELSPTYRINGAVIVISVDLLLKHQSYFVEPLGGYQMPAERSIDIDTEMDLRLAEFMISQQNTDR